MLRRMLTLFAAVLVLFALAAPNAFAQGHCKAFTGTGVFKLDFTTANPAWTGDAYFSIGGSAPRLAKVVFIAGEWTKDLTQTALGSETALVEFADTREQIQLVGRFTLTHLTNPAGIFRINETGEILAPGTPKVRPGQPLPPAGMMLIGHYTCYGPWGPGLPGASSDVWVVIADYNGNICDAG